MCSRYATLCNSARTSTLAYHVSYVENYRREKNSCRAAPTCCAVTAAVCRFRQFIAASLRTANGRSGFFRCSIFCFQFLRGRVLGGGFARGFRSRRTRATAGIEIELAHLVEQRFVTDTQHLRRVFAAPICFLQR